MKKIIVIVVLMLFSPVFISAACDVDESNIKISDSTNSFHEIYTITIDGLTNGLYAVDNFGIKYTNDNNTVNPADYGNYLYTGGNTYKFDFYDDTCGDTPVLTLEHKILFYNKNYDKNYCKKNSSFEYCSEYLEKPITDGEFQVAKEKYDEKAAKRSDDTKKLFILTVVTGCCIVAIVFVILFYKKKSK